MSPSDAGGGVSGHARGPSSPGDDEVRSDSEEYDSEEEREDALARCREALIDGVPDDTRTISSSKRGPGSSSTPGAALTGASAPNDSEASGLGLELGLFTTGLAPRVRTDPRDRSRRSRRLFRLLVNPRGWRGTSRATRPSRSGCSRGSCASASTGRHTPMNAAPMNRGMTKRLAMEAARRTARR